MKLRAMISAPSETGHILWSVASAMPYEAGLPIRTEPWVRCSYCGTCGKSPKCESCGASLDLVGECHLE